MKKVVQWNSQASPPTPRPRASLRIKNNDDVLPTLVEHLRPGALFALVCSLDSYRSPTATYPVLTKGKGVRGNRNSIAEEISLKRGTLAIFAGETRVSTEMKGKDVKTIAYLFVVNARMYAIMDLHFVKAIIDRDV